MKNSRYRKVLLIDDNEIDNFINERMITSSGFSAEVTVKNSADELIKQIDSVFTNKKTKSPEHLVLLAHDQVYQKSKDSTELRLLIQKLKLKKEYELSLVSNYPGTAN